MSYALLFIATTAIFLALDAAMLRTVMRPLFKQYLGDALLDTVRVVPAISFYLFYILVLLWLVTAPALDGQSLARVALDAAMFGAAAYGTYEFTNLSTLRDWSWKMVAVDVSWGTILTTVSALGGLIATRALMQ